jgi:hypothetical protein
MDGRLNAPLLLLTLLLLVGCGGEATPSPDLVATEVAVQKAAAATLTAEAPRPTPQPTPTEAVSPSPTEIVPSTPTEMVPPTPTVAPPPPPEAEATYWVDFCQPSPKEEGQLVANLDIGSTAELDAYLYVKSFSNIRDGMMPFTLKEIPYASHEANWLEACQIHVFIPIGTGPNHVGELPDRFQFGDVVVWDKTGQEIRGWQRNLDSFHVRVVGVVVETYGEDTGLGGSNTIRLQEIELLES